MSVVLDAGALVALERNDRILASVLKDELAAGRRPRTHTGVIGQVWRGGRGQALLGMALRGVEVRAIDDELGRRAGTLLGLTGGSDVMNAAIVLITEDGDQVLTADPEDLRRLAAAAGKDITLTKV